MKYLGRITDDNDLVNKKYVDDTVSESENIIANEYSSSSTYALGSYVIYEDNLYRCTTAITTAEAWNSAHWTQVTVGGEFVNNKNAHNTLQNLIGANTQLITGELENTANFYNPANTYNVGDYVLQSVTTQSGTKYNLFRCTTQISTPEAWNSSHWVQTTIGEDLSNTVTQEDLEQFAFGEIFQLRSNGVNKGLNWDWDNTTLHLHGTQIKDPNVTYDSSFYSIFYGQIANSCIIPGSNLALTNSKISGDANNPPYLNMNFYGEGGSLLDDRSFNLNTTRTNTQILVPDGTLSVDIFIVKDYVSGSENVDWTGKIQLFGYVNGQMIGDTFNKVAEDLSDLESDVSNVKSVLYNNNSVGFALSPQGRTHNGVVFTKVSNSEITAVGTATADALCVLYNGSVTSGSIFCVNLDFTGSGDIIFEIFTKNHDDASWEGTYFNGSGYYYYTVADEKDMMLVRIRVANGKTVNKDCKFELLSRQKNYMTSETDMLAKFNRTIMTTETDPFSEQSVDLNNISGDHFYLLSDGHTYSNAPTGFGIGFLLTTLTHSNFDFQLLWQFSGGSMWKRRGKNGTWENWQQITGISYVNNYSFPEYSNTYTIESVTPTITTDTNAYLASSGDTTNRTAEIVTMLQTVGVCRLGKGDYYIENLDMPDGTSIVGSGYGTRIILAGTSDGYAIKLGNYCNVSDCQIVGALSAITLSNTVGGRHGILWQGNYTQDETAAHQPQKSMLSNLWIARFTGGGITCYDTGYGTVNNIECSNVYVENCNSGINISYKSEFHKFTNVRTFSCYYGCINNGGNNVFVNCDFSSCKLGFLIDNSTGQSPNNSHGSCVSCVFNHTDSNNGIGIKLLGAANGYVFDGCQIFYSQIYIENSNGIVVSNSNFGATNCNITIVGGNTILFANNMHQDKPTISITNNTKVHFVNCYDRDSGASISA